ncbi:rhomboid-domain-containing protein [Artomyces pyxidatus]|uniref:Rhomboid-domain-containing protein n=1 Tax=Artomyces pyxidatus TaxID=48021 RepID=A0ACB8TKU9_9AGAM|nr:rhomboid-domain-containing protein [Artomyces pyxidatus]
MGFACDARLQDAVLQGSHLTSPRVPPRISSTISRLYAGLVRFRPTGFVNATHRDLRPRASASSRFSQHPGGPWQRFTRGFDRIPSDFLFYGIILANGAVFASWQYATVRYHMQRTPDLIIWMQENFTTSWKNVSQGRWWTVLASCFSHQDLTHIFMNGFTYFFMAPTVLRILGNTRFLALYFGGGVISSLASLQWHKGKRDYSSHGASGAIYAVISFYACVSPRTTFLIFGLIPCPAWAFVSGVFLFDSYSAYAEKRQGTDTAGHVGGLLAGIAYFLFRARFGR